VQVSAELPPWTIKEARETVRYLELRHWLRHEVGTCALCAMRLSVLGVENEEGRKTTMDKFCLLNEKVSCDDKARAAWGKRPRHAQKEAVQP